MMRDTVAAFSVFLMLFVFGASCTMCIDGCSSAAFYTNDLDACVERATTWPVWVECCERTALKYGRDPSFCGGHDAGR